MRRENVGWTLRGMLLLAAWGCMQSVSLGEETFSFRVTYTEPKTKLSRAVLDNLDHVTVFAQVHGDQLGAYTVDVSASSPAGGQQMHAVMTLTFPDATIEEPHEFTVYARAYNTFGHGGTISESLTMRGPFPRVPNSDSVPSTPGVLGVDRIACVDCPEEGS